MPTYDYECPKGHRFEIFQRISDEPGAECPECGAEARRLISGGAGFLFKGEGFYITDYRSEEYKKKASKEPGAGAASGGSAGSSSDGDGGAAGSSGGDSASGGGSGSSGGGGSESSSGGGKESGSGGGSSSGSSSTSTDS